MIAPLLRVDDLHVRNVDQGAAVTAPPTPDSSMHGLGLTVHIGETHAILGSSGAGASQLAAALMGGAGSEAMRGSISLLGDDITDWPTDERAKAGMFLTAHTPATVPGVSLSHMLSEALSARKRSDLTTAQLRHAISEWSARLGLQHTNAQNPDAQDIATARISEIIQMAILAPRVAIVDHLDAGLDAEEQHVIAAGLDQVRSEQPDLGMILVSPAKRVLDETSPDYIHILVNGHIARSGGMELAEQLERPGHDPFSTEAAR